MGMPWLDGVLFFVGLTLVLMPAKPISNLLNRHRPHLLQNFVEVDDPDRLRLVKLVIGLICFSVGTMGIHREIRTEVGDAFLFTTLLGLVILSLVKVWWKTRED